MGAKSANLYVRIEPEVKEKAEEIFSELGIPVSNAINIFYRQVVIHRGLPFEVKLSAKKPVCMGKLTEEEIESEIKKGLVGKGRPAEDVFDDMRKDYNL